MNKITHTAKIQANRVLVFFIWLILMVFPGLSLFYVADIVIKKLEVQRLEQIKEKLNFELLAFKSDANYVTYVNDLIQRFSYCFDEQKNIEEAVKQFEQHSQTTLALAFSYDSFYDKTDMHVNPLLHSRLPFFSAKRFKHFIKRLSSADHIEYDKLLKDSDNSKRSSIFFKSIFKLSSDTDIKANTAIPFLSGLPNIGKCVFYLYTLDKNPKTNYYNSVLLIFRERDILPQRIISAAQEKIINRGFTRNLVYEKNLDTLNFTSTVGHNYIQNEKGISLTGYPSEDILVTYITKGTYYPIQLEQAQNNTPMFKVTADKNLLLHPLRSKYNAAKLPALIAFMIGSLIIIRLGIFGYKTGTDLLSRICSAIAASALIPFSIFSISLYFSQSYNQEQRSLRLKQFAAINTDNLIKRLNAFITNKETLLTRITEQAGSFDNFDESIKFLAEQIKKLNVRNISFQNNENIRTIVYNKGNKDEICFYNDKSKACDQFGEELEKQPVYLPTDTDNRQVPIEKDIGKALYLLFYDSLKKVNFDADIKDSVRSYKLDYDISGMKNNIIKAGELSILEGGYLNRIYRCAPVIRQNNQDKYDSALKAFLLYSLDTNSLIEEFIKEEQQLLKPDAIKGYEVKYCFIPIEQQGELPANAKFIFSSPLNPSLVQEYANQMSSDFSKQEIVLGNQMVSSAMYRKLNTVIMSFVEQLDNGNDSNAWIYFLSFIYFLITITAVMSLLKNYFVLPILLLKKGSEAVKSNNYDYKADYRSKDEFEILTNTFNDMTEGLKQKEELSKYVSETVIQEIENDQGNNLKPGGERIKTSVVFCSLGGFENYRKSHSIKESADVLGELVDTADKAAKNNNGLTDKLIEDTIMLVFRQIDQNDNNYAERACKAALEISEHYKGIKDLFIKAGISSGSAVSGKIGSHYGKLDFTVIGNPVNLAARFKVQAHKAKNTGILICPQTIKQLKGKGRLNYIERTAIKGRTNRTFPLYELLELREF